MVLKQSIVSVEEFKGWGLPNQVQDISDALLSSWLLQTSRIVDLSINNLVSRLDLLNPDTNIPSTVLEDIKQAVIELVNYFMGGNYVGDEQKVSQTFNNGIASFQRDADTFGSLKDAFPVIVRAILQNSVITSYEFNPDASPQISPTEYLRKEDATSNNIGNDSTKVPGTNVTQALDSLHDEVAKGWDYDAEGNKLTNVGDGVNPTDGINKKQLDAKVSLPPELDKRIDYSTPENTLIFSADKATPDKGSGIYLEPTEIDVVVEDRQVMTITKDNVDVAGNMSLNDNKITGLGAPTEETDAINKKYFDDNKGGGGSSELVKINRDNINNNSAIDTITVKNSSGEVLEPSKNIYFSNYENAALPLLEVPFNNVAPSIIRLPENDTWEPQIEFTTEGTDFWYQIENKFFFKTLGLFTGAKKFTITTILSDKDGTIEAFDKTYDFSSLTDEELPKLVVEHNNKMVLKLQDVKNPYSIKVEIRGVDGTSGQIQVQNTASFVTGDNKYIPTGSILKVVKYDVPYVPPTPVGDEVKVKDFLDIKASKLVVDDVLFNYGSSNIWNQQRLGIWREVKEFVDTGTVYQADKVRLRFSDFKNVDGDVNTIDFIETDVDINDIPYGTASNSNVSQSFQVRILTGAADNGTQLELRFNLSRATSDDGSEYFINCLDNSVSLGGDGHWDSFKLSLTTIKQKGSLGLQGPKGEDSTGFPNDIMNYENSLNLGHQNTQLDNLEIGDRILYRDYSNRNLAAQHTPITSLQSAIPLPNLNTWINEYDFVVSEDGKYNAKHLFFFKLLFSTDNKKFRIGSAFHDATTGIIKGAQEQDFDFSKYTNDEIKEVVFNWFRNINVDLVTGSTYVYRMTLQGLDGSVGTLSPVVELSAPHLYDLPDKSHFELAHLISKIKPAHKQNMEVQVWHSVTRAGGGDNAIVPITSWGEITEKTNKELFEYDDTTHKFHPTAYLVNLANNSPDGVLIQIEFQCAGYISAKPDYYVNCVTDFTGTVTDNLLLAIQVATSSASYLSNNSNTVYKIVKFFPKNLQSTDSFKLLKKAVDVSQADIYPPYNMLITNLYLTGVKGDKGDPGTSTPVRELMYNETRTIAQNNSFTFNMSATGNHNDFRNIEVVADSGVPNFSPRAVFIDPLSYTSNDIRIIHINPVPSLQYVNLDIPLNGNTVRVYNNSGGSKTFTVKMTGERIPVPRKKEVK